ncbi:unnamed protein product [Discula destructiva]
MVVLSFSSGASRGTFYTITSLVGFLATITNAIPSQYGVEDYTSAMRRMESLGECLATAGVKTSLPTNSSSWTADIEAWNSRISPVPSAVIFPTTEEQVTAALACAQTTKTKVTTLGGNRSFSSMAFGRNDGALIVNLINMKVMEFDESTGVLTYGGPVTISDAFNFLWNGWRRAVAHGRCSDVGMTGVAAAGFGTLSRALGTVLDNIVGVRVALANGTIVDADAQVNEDIYWAVRGAASSMGVVLKFRLNTFEIPSPIVTNYTIQFPGNYTPTQQENVDLLLGIQAWAQSEHNNDMLSVRMGIRTSSKLEGFFYGTSEEWASVSASLMKFLPASLEVTGTEFDFYTSENITTPGIVEGTITPRRYFYVASVTIPETSPLDNETAWQWFSNTAYAPKPENGSASGFVDLWSGQYTKTVSADTSAWKHDGNLLLMRWDLRSKSYDVSFPDSTLETLRSNFYTFVDAYKSAGGEPGGFTTYRDDEWTKKEVAEYLYGENYPRLQQIKTTYDPNELFNTDPQAIPALKKK